MRLRDVTKRFALRDLDSGLIEAEDTSTAIAYALPPRGPAGPPGPPGAGFTWTQATPSAVWTIAHNLGIFPDVSVTTLGGLAFYGTVQHLTDDVLTITFSTPQTGLARLT